MPTMPTALATARTGSIPTATATESISASFLPWPREDAKARYLGYRASGFSVKEALNMMGYSKAALSTWRNDSEFATIEARLPEYRKQISTDYAFAEFVRNFRLIMEKDVRVIKRSLSYRPEDVLTKQEHDYLLKLRTFYTPQQLQVMQAMLTGETRQEFNWVEVVKAIAQRTDKVTITRSESIELERATDVELNSEVEREVSNLPEPDDNTDED